MTETVDIGKNVPADTPTVSIIIPCYKTAELVAETLDSVFAQTFTDYEVILVNDGSPDAEDLRKVIYPYREKLIFIDKSKNTGCGDSRNLGAKCGRGEYFVFLDSDDIWHPPYLDDTINYLTTNHFDLVYTSAECFGMQIWASGNNQSYNPDAGEISRDLYVAGKCHILPSGALMKADAFRTLGGFDPDIPGAEDFHFFMRLLFGGKRIGYLKKNLLRYRIRAGSLTGNLIDRCRYQRDVWPALMKILPFTDREKQTISVHIARGDAALLRAEGRLAVVDRDWPTAREKFRMALLKSADASLPLVHRIRIFGVCMMLRFYPAIVHLAMIKLRQDELPHMPASL
jgi:glycosyltransferase involved in cell wall biosynthesis